MSLDSKKDIYRYNNKGMAFDSSTMETLQEMNPKFDIEDSIYDEFIEKLTISKFKEFSLYCKEKEIDNLKHNMKLKKFQFIQIMKNVFPGKVDFFPLFEQIFNRFKLLKCKIIHNPINDNYFINNIYSNEEIDIFEISCALACFLKCFFLEKLKILFDLADIDEDGFINGVEVKKLIYTINYLFCREDNSLKVESNVALLSLASIKAKKSYDLIMKHPGNLLYVIQEEKYINFNHFISAVERIYNYKYSLMPLFISLKYSLNLNRNEKELELRSNNFNDYSKISNEVVSLFKKEGDIGKSNFDFKKSLEIEKNNNNNYQIKTANLILKQNSNNLSNNESAKSFQNLKIITSRNTNEKNLRYNINYNKICGLEVYPGKLKIKEKEKERNNIGNVVQNKYNKISFLTKSVNINENRKGGTSGYMTLVEILEEINTLINKQKKIDAGGEELSKIWNETKIQNERTSNQLSEPFPPTNIESLKPYIFDEIFQKKLLK